MTELVVPDRIPVMNAGSVENLAKAIAETGTINVIPERRYGRLTWRTWFELNGEGDLSSSLEHAILSERVISLRPVERILSEHMDSLLQRSIDVASDPWVTAILLEELKRFQQGDHTYLHLHTYPVPSWDSQDIGFVFQIQKPQAV